METKEIERELATLHQNLTLLITLLSQRTNRWDYDYKYSYYVPYHMAMREVESKLGEYVSFAQVRKDLAPYAVTLPCGAYVPVEIAENYINKTKSEVSNER